ncbi:MAG: hypothetical protein J6U10_06345, partial [Lachnospiraceae bacterium]|nr:hypothetical protein [Lachnospiraceae bacterium]
AKKGQKKSSVAATVTHKGRKISLKVDMVADKKITYTGKKISPKDLGYEIDLTDLYNEALTEGAGKPKDLFKISYLSKNNLHKSTSGKKASFYAKVTLDEDKARSAGLGDDGIAKLKALVKALNTKLKKNPCTYTVQAVKISAKTSKVNAVVTLKGSKISRVKSIKVSAKVNGKQKIFKLKKGQYTVKVKDAAKGTVVITGKGDFTGSVTVKAASASDSGLKYGPSGTILADTPDMTGYKPKDWSWKAEGDGYGRKYFTSGKYVRSDGRAVLYIESSDSPDAFSFQLFAIAGGAKQSNYTTYNNETKGVNLWASNTSDTEANTDGIYMRSFGNGCIDLTTKWTDEMYMQYDDPAGFYYLVREKG